MLDCLEDNWWSHWFVFTLSDPIASAEVGLTAYRNGQIVFAMPNVD